MFRRAAPRSENPMRNPPRRMLRRLLVLGGAATVVVVLAYLIVWLPDRLDCEGADLAEQAGECLGVTDGSPDFEFTGEVQDDALVAEFQTIQQRIKEENDRVADEAKKFVKVGLLATLTASETGPHTPRRVLHALEGAYTAQLRANQTHQLGDPSPQIQLHLANVGSRHERWEPAVKQLVSMADDLVPLVAVAGLSMSTKDSRAAARELAEHDIPIIGSSASADGLNSETVKGLVRVTPSNTDFVMSLRQYARQRDNLAEAVLVYDENAPDLHVHTLTQAFEKHFAGELKSNADQPFQGETLEEDAPVALFDPAARNICDAEPDMVLFSGRTSDLHAFIAALHERSCRDQPLSVLFAETGSVIEDSELDALAESNLTVVQASAMDPAWALDADRSPHTPRGMAGFLEQYDTHFDHVDDVPEALADGYVVANHDALATAVQAIRLTHEEDPDDSLNGTRVRDALFLLNSGNPVEAASGTLHFTTDRHGDPGGKPVPILESPPGSTSRAPYTTPSP